MDAAVKKTNRAEADDDDSLTICISLGGRMARLAESNQSRIGRRRRVPWPGCWRAVCAWRLLPGGRGRGLGSRAGGRDRSAAGADGRGRKGGGAAAANPAARSDRPVTAEEKIKFEQDKAHAPHARARRPDVPRGRTLAPDAAGRFGPLVDGGRPVPRTAHRGRDARSGRPDLHPRPQQGDHRRERGHRQARGAEAAVAHQRSRLGAQARTVAEAAGGSRTRWSS